MKRRIIASTLVVSLVSVTGALAHDDENHGKKVEPHTDDHAAALGKPGDPGRVTRSSRWRWTTRCASSPQHQGETRRAIRFVWNAGKVKHEMVLGTFKELKGHAELMGNSR